VKLKLDALPMRGQAELSYLYEKLSVVFLMCAGNFFTLNWIYAALEKYRCNEMQ
jgi:hypothetical protein